MIKYYNNYININRFKIKLSAQQVKKKPSCFTYPIEYYPPGEFLMKYSL